MDRLRSVGVRTASRQAKLGPGIRPQRLGNADLIPAIAESEPAPLAKCAQIAKGRRPTAALLQEPDMTIIERPVAISKPPKQQSPKIIAQEGGSARLKLRRLHHAG